MPSTLDPNILKKDFFRNVLKDAARRVVSMAAIRSGGHVLHDLIGGTKTMHFLPCGEDAAVDIAITKDGGIAVVKLELEHEVVLSIHELDRGVPEMRETLRTLVREFLATGVIRKLGMLRSVTAFGPDVSAEELMERFDNVERLIASLPDESVMYKSSNVLTYNSSEAACGALGNHPTMASTVKVYMQTDVGPAHVAGVNVVVGEKVYSE